MIVWIIVAFFSGLLAYLFLPSVVAPFLGYDAKQAIADKYLYLGQLAMQRSAVGYVNGGLDLSVASPTDDYNADDVNVKEDAKLRDDAGRRSKLATRPFGIAHADYGTYLDARDLEIGEAAAEAKDAGELRADEPLELERTFRAADPSAARRILSRNGNPEDVSDVDTFIKHSLSKYSSRGDIVRAMTIAVAFGIGVAPFFLASYVGETAPSGGTTIPVDIAPLLLGVVV